MYYERPFMYTPLEGDDTAETTAHCSRRSVGIWTLTSGVLIVVGLVSLVALGITGPSVASTFSLFRSSSNSVYNPTYKAYEPFSPCNVESYIDGEDYFATLAAILDRAEKEVIITGWVLSPEAVLTGRGTNSARTFLDVIGDTAARGVDIFVLFWDAPRPMGRDMFTKRVVEGMEMLSNVGAKVLKDEGMWYSARWQQHQKAITIDRKVAFVGGLDVSVGRWDTQLHTVMDPRRWEQSNDGDGWDNTKKYMPWHDVQALVDGAAARAVSRNLAQRWNLVCARPFSITRNRRKQEGCKFHMSEGDVEWTSGMDVTEFLGEYGSGNEECEVTRQMGKWNSGVPTERTSYAAYLDVIRQSKRFIYIENQYFGSYPFSENIVSVELFNKIKEALNEKRKYSVVVVIPSGISYAQYTNMMQTTILYDEHSIWKNLTRLLDEKAHDTSLSDVDRRWYSKVDPYDYLSFFYLASQKVEEVPSEQRWRGDHRGIYVHSKIMIADDTVAIVGSSNICDRSFKGDRDSELGITVRPRKVFECAMDGEKWQCGSYAHRLRMRLTSEHLGLMDMNDVNDFGETFRSLRTAASVNSHVRTKVFGFDPRHAKFSRDFRAVYNGGWQVEVLSDNQRDMLGRVQGTMYNYPVDFWGATPEESGVRSWINTLDYTENAFK